jgi:hypothetical protein
MIHDTSCAMFLRKKSVMKLVNSVRNRRPSISIRLARQGWLKLGMRFLDFVGGLGCKTWKVG